MKRFSYLGKHIFAITATLWALTLVVTGVGCGSADDLTSGNKTYSFLDNKESYVEKGLDIDWGPGTSSLETADVLILQVGTKVKRGKVVQALNSHKPVAFVGEGSQDYLIATLLNVEETEARDAVSKGIPKPDDIEYSFGLEYGEPSNDYVAIASPHDTVLDIHLYSTNEPSHSYVLECLDKTFNRYSSGGLKSRASLGEESNYLGFVHTEGEIQPYGKYKKFVLGYEAADGYVPGHDRIGFEICQVIEPGCDIWDSNNWQNDYIFRGFDFDENAGYEIVDYGPGDTQSQSKAQVSLSPGMSWSYTVSDVDIVASSDVTLECVNWKHDVDRDAASAETGYIAEPGLIVQTLQGADPIVYQHNTQWQWFKDVGFWDRHQTHSTHGPGTFYR
ncbi:MAG: hypothetical protein ACLFPU_08380 [Dehalococcoidia bacterium]